MDKSKRQKTPAQLARRKRRRKNQDAKRKTQKEKTPAQLARLERRHAKKKAKKAEARAEREAFYKAKAEAEAAEKAAAPKKRGRPKGAFSALKIEANPTNENSSHIIGFARESRPASKATLRYIKETLAEDVENWKSVTSYQIPATIDYIIFDKLKAGDTEVPGDSRREEINPVGLRTAASKAKGYSVVFARGSSGLPTNKTWLKRFLNILPAKKVLLLISMYVSEDLTKTKSNDQLAAMLEGKKYDLLRYGSQRYYEIDLKRLFHAFSDKRRESKLPNYSAIHQIWKDHLEVREDNSRSAKARIDKVGVNRNLPNSKKRERTEAETDDNIGEKNDMLSNQGEATIKRPRGRPRKLPRT